MHLLSMIYQNICERFQKENKVMVWCAISKNGKFPMVFVESGIRINANYYIENILEPVLKVHSQTMYSNQEWTFQQDSAPAHKAKITQQWCRSQLSDFIASSEWLPSSPDLNPLDYSIWGILEARVSLENIRAAIDSWPKRLRAAVKQGGGRFE